MLDNADMAETASEALTALMAVIKDYMADGDLDVDKFSSATPLGDAGLDSLDMLKLARWV